MAQLGAGMLRVLRDAGDDNDASVRNFAASLARGDYLLLLSPQMVIGESDWLDELINHALRPEVAVVGARILSPQGTIVGGGRSEEHTSELQSLMRISYAVFCLKKKKKNHITIYSESGSTFSMLQ